MSVMKAVAVGAMVLLVAGGAWRVGAADAKAAAPRAAAVVATAADAPGVRGRVDSYADIVSAVSPAVVTIRIESKSKSAPVVAGEEDLFRRFFRNAPGEEEARPRAFRRQGLGSGVVVTNDGYILTNHHVVDGADNIRVDFNDGRTLTAKLVGSDKPSDLALIKVEASGLRTIAMGDSDAVRVGDVVLAIGNPLGVGQTVTMGIVSAKGRATGVGDGSYEDFLQTDAPINQGNSGGALVNVRGELVGINSQILSPSGGNIGIGFAIPAKMAGHVMTALKTDGRVRRSQLGVSIQPVTSDLAASLGIQDVHGAIISAVSPGSAADRAGLKRGDIITAFDGQPVLDVNGLRNRVANTDPSTSATVKITRDGASRDVTVKLDETAATVARRGSADDEESGGRFGVAVAPATPEVAERAGLPRGARGLVVQDVDPDSRAAEAGLQPGDLIQEVNRQAVSGVDDLRAALRRSQDRPVLLLINRGGRDLFLTARPS